MIKPGQLRDHLLKAVPGLAANPDRLLVFVEDGHVSSAYSHNLSFSYAYTLNLIITDFGGNPDSIMLPVLQWLTRHQPELLANPARRGEVKFEVDVLANDLVDVSLTLPLTERVVVNPDADGGLTLTNAPEPPSEQEVAPALAGGMVTNAQGVVVATLPAITE